MAATVITVLSVDEDGIEPAYTAATVTEGDKFDNDDRTWVHIVNGAVACVASIKAVSAKPSKFIKGFGDVLLPDVTITVPANEERVFQCPPARFNDGSGQCTIICDDVTNVTIAAFKITIV